VLPWSIKTYFRSRQWRDEKVLLQQSALAVPRNVEIQLLLGDHHTREADYRSAQAYYRRASEISADCTEAGLRLAASYRQTGMYEEALASTRRLCPSAPKEKALRATEIGRIFVAMENYSPAARSFEDSLGHFEMDAVVHRELGMLYLHMLGEPDRGRRHLRRSLELDSSQPAASVIRELLARP